jgi:ribosomal RNA small subunit methyltransferase A
LSDWNRRTSIRKIRALGQHLLVSDEIADKIVSEAMISTSDKVVEIGTGEGILTRKLAEKAIWVRTYEIDPEMCHKAKRLLADLKNVDLVCKDAFLESPEFDVCVTSLPYSESRRFLKWVSTKQGFKRIVAIVQKEFADKMTSRPRLESYRAVSVMAQLSFVIEPLAGIQRNVFSPPPRVSSELLRLTPLASSPFFDRQRLLLLNRLFSNRRKTLSAALHKMGGKLSIEASIPFKKRVEALTPEEFAEVIVLLEKKGH